MLTKAIILYGAFATRKKTPTAKTNSQIDGEILEAQALVTQYKNQLKFAEGLSELTQKARLAKNIAIHKHPVKSDQSVQAIRSFVDATNLQFSLASPEHKIKLQKDLQEAQLKVAELKNEKKKEKKHNQELQKSRKAYMR